MHTNDVTNKRVYYVPTETWEHDLEHISDSDLTEERLAGTGVTNGVKCFMHGYLHKGDYDDNGFVGQSNVKIFEEDFSDHPDVRFFHSWPAFVGVLIREGTEDESILEILEGLENYPVVDEDHLGELEQEARDEAWEDFIKRDFSREIEKALEIEELSEHLDSDGIDHLFQVLCERTNSYIEPDGNGMWIDVSKLAEACDFADIEDSK